MKSAFLMFLAVAVIGLGFSVFSLKKELLSARENAVFFEERSNELQRELMRLHTACGEKERFLEEIKQSIAELESKVDLETLERHIPKKTWDEIKPIIDKLKAFREQGEDGSLSQKRKE